MSAARRWMRRLGYLVNRRSLERELEREMASHRAMMGDPRRFGSTLRLREESADIWGWTWLERLGQDVRYAARLLRRRPILSATAVLTLMLGMGGTTAVFSLIDALHLRRLPVADPDALVRLTERRTDGTLVESFTLATHDTLQRGSRTFSGVIASAEEGAGPGEIFVGRERRSAFMQLVSDNYFDVLGVHASQGRVFHQPRPGTPGEAIAVISDEYWRRQYAADPSVLGTRFRRGNREFIIAGITPPGFRGTEIDVPIDIWVSIEQVVLPNAPERIRGRWMRVMGRLRPDVTMAQAEAESTALLGRPVQLQTGGIGYSTLRERLNRPLLLVALVVTLVLLIACANLGNLMLAATVSREREIAVRAAIGASRARIVGQLMTESLLLALLGSALGLVVARGTSGALLAFLPPEQAVALPSVRFGLDARVLGFAALLSIGACLLFGTAPALRGSGRIAATALKVGTGADRRNRSAFSRGLLVGQVVMCTALLVVAGVFVRTVQNLRGQDAGYREDRLLVADIGFPSTYRDEPRDRLIEDLRARAAALPGVEIAAFSHVGQLSGFGMEWDVGFPGGNRPDRNVAGAMEQRVSPGFLAAMGTPFVSGRDFGPADDAIAPLVAIVNEAFARQFLPGENPIGAGFFVKGGSRSGETLKIVGVVRDAKWVTLRESAPPMYYRPYRQMGGTPTVRLVVRTSGDPEPVARELVRVAESVDRQIRLGNVVPFTEIVNRTLVVERLVSHVSTAFGVLALLIAAVGLYGAVAYGIARRRREIGLRIAVGAEPGRVERMFLRESLTLVAGGMVLGIPIAIVVTRLASSLLFGLTPYDPASIAAALTALLMTTAAAAYLPARSAAQVDPIQALRED
jgi:predicted permease